MTKEISLCDSFNLLKQQIDEKEQNEHNAYIELKFLRKENMDLTKKLDETLQEKDKYVIFEGKWCL